MPLADQLAGRLYDRLRDRVERWAVESQAQARRNALVGSTALAARRAEIADVEEFFAARDGRAVPQVPAPRSGESAVGTAGTADEGARAAR